MNSGSPERAGLTRAGLSSLAGQDIKKRKGCILEILVMSFLHVVCTSTLHYVWRGMSVWPNPNKAAEGEPEPLVPP